MPKTLVLLSGTTRKEYFLDSLETISLPTGSNQHYRYDKRWLNTDFIIEELKKSDIQENLLVCMLLQEKIGEHYIWKKIIPLRKAKLRSCDIEKENNVTNFYFELGELVFPHASFQTKLKDYFGESYNKNYVHVIENDDFLEKNKTIPQSLQRLSEEISDEKIKDYNGVEYAPPLFLHLIGLRTKMDGILYPKYDNLTKKVFYKLSEGSRYVLEYISVIPNPKTNLGYDLKIKTDSNCFSTPEERIVNITAKHDQDFIDFLPTLSDKNIWSIINIEIQNHSDAANANSVDNLTVKLPLYVLIKVRKLRFFFELMGDITLALATLSIGVQKIFENNWPSWLYFSWTQYFFGLIILTLFFKTLKFLWKK